LFVQGGFDSANLIGRHGQFYTNIRQETQLLLFGFESSGGILFPISPENPRHCVQEVLKKSL
jgi:hypothetical protein